MSTWSQLRVQIREWLQLQASPFTSFPDPRHDDQTPPFDIGLRAWATSIAEELHAQFGPDVRLTVGLLSYPEGELPEYRRRSVEWRPEMAPEVELRVEEVAPLIVGSGHTAVLPVWVTNTSSMRKVLETNGALQSRVLDSRGRHVGCAEGAQTLAGIDFSIDPGERVQVPVVIGTSSFDPALGYAIPPGTWTLEVYLPTPEQMEAAHLPLALTD